jgi:hypothetical protein
MKASSEAQKSGRSGWLYLKGGIFRALLFARHALLRLRPTYCARRQAEAMKLLLTDGVIEAEMTFNFPRVAIFCENYPVSPWRGFELPAFARLRMKKSLRRAFDMMPP